MSTGIDLAAAFNDTFGIQQKPAPASDKVMPIDKLKPFKNHPYRVTDLDELASSISENGIMVPITVRQLPGGLYEIISGHRRVEAAKAVGLNEVPVFIKELSDDDAIIEMVDSNIARTDILPSEKRNAYKMRMEAAQRRGEKKTAVETITQMSGDSRSQVYRFLQMDNLIDPYMDKVDAGDVSVDLGAMISSMPPQRQQEMYEYQETYGKELSKDDVVKIKESNSDMSIESVLQKKPVGRPKTEYIKLKVDDISRYFPNKAELPIKEYKEELTRNVLKTLYDLLGDNEE